MIDFHTHKALPDAIINGVPDNSLFRYSVGVHPWSSSTFDASQFSEIENMASMPQVVMIGECGIDKLRGADLQTQISLFRRHVELSENVQKPLVIHCVRAYQEIANIHKQMSPSQAWAIHGFRGNAQIARQLTSQGIYLSYGEKYNVEALRATPLDKIFVETDESALDITDVYTKIAEDIGISVAQLQAQIAQNMRAIKVPTFF